MSKFELSLAKNYVPSWTLVDGVRELFQNAIDQQVQNPDNEMSYSYDSGTETLRICNKKSTLTTKTLLLGTTTKAEDKATIGQFGEGYKVATLVLLRCGKRVTFYNYGAKEVWHTRFVKSRRYDAEVLTFDVDKYVWTKTPNADLTVEIAGISADEYNELLVPANLYLQDAQQSGLETPFGYVLKDEKYKGQVFVNGLFVCRYDKYKYGYNFKPEYVRLDRDRKLVSDFDLKWMASRMWSANPNDALELVAEGAADTEYINDVGCYNTTNRTELNNAAYNKFLVTYGPKAVPVSTQDEADKVPAGYRAIIVPGQYKGLIRNGVYWKDPEPEPTALEKMWMWFQLFGEQLDGDASESFEEIYYELERG